MVALPLLCSPAFGSKSLSTISALRRYHSGKMLPWMQRPSSWGSCVCFSFSISTDWPWIMNNLVSCSGWQPIAHPAEMAEYNRSIRSTNIIPNYDVDCIGSTLSAVSLKSLICFSRSSFCRLKSFTYIFLVDSYVLSVLRRATGVREWAPRDVPDDTNISDWISLWCICKVEQA